MILIFYKQIYPFLQILWHSDENCIHPRDFTDSVPCSMSAIVTGLRKSASKCYFIPVMSTPSWKGERRNKDNKKVEPASLFCPLLLHKATFTTTTTTALVFETCLKLGELQCKSNFNRY